MTWVVCEEGFKKDLDKVRVITGDADPYVGGVGRRLIQNCSNLAHPFMTVLLEDRIQPFF
jgi:hypothetical protein